MINMTGGNKEYTGIKIVVETSEITHAESLECDVRTISKEDK